MLLLLEILTLLFAFEFIVYIRDQVGVVVELRESINIKKAVA